MVLECHDYLALYAQHGSEANGARMPDSNTPIMLVICNDYGELACALYLLEGQAFAKNTTLMLPPRLYANNPDVLPGRTFLYHSLDDVRNKMDSQKPGILGLFTGYLLPIHRLCEIDELDSLLRSTQAKGWRTFTTDPFFGLLDDIEPGKLVRFRWSLGSIIRVSEAMERKRDRRLYSELQRLLEGIMHVYPCGEPPASGDPGFGKRLHFHNNAFASEPIHESSKVTLEADHDSQRWLFVLGDLDYAIQTGKYGHKFPLILTRKLHDTLEAGRVPTVIAPNHVLEAVRKHSPVAHAMELVGHCDYSQFQSLLLDAEYVFYWNASSFSCIPRTLSGKPWFTFDDGHLLKGLSADYANRLLHWFYRDEKPPYIDISATLSKELMQDARQQYLTSAQRIREGLLASSDPQALLSALDTRRPLLNPIRPTESESTAV